MNFIVKVCGVTRPEDAEVAVAAGADMIGLNFWRGSKRYVEENQAHEILAAISGRVKSVGVFVNAHPLVVTETWKELALDRVQLHGDEKVGDFANIDMKHLIRVLRVQDAESLKEARAWDAGLFICDAHSPDFGGAGLLAPWTLVAGGATRPFLLAGGLTPDNVGDGIRATRPDGVDVASGVESEPGIKDAAKMRAFVANARAAAQAIGRA